MNTRTHMPQPSNSDVELFEEDLKSNMAHLLKYVEGLPERDQDFALSLCAYYDNNDRLSKSQMTYACKFWQYINENVGEAGGRVEPEPSARKDETPPRVVINGSSLIAMFDKASQELKYPSIKFYITPGWNGLAADHIKFYRTGVLNKRYGEGCVMLIFSNQHDAGEKYTLGIIARDGRFAFSRFCFDRPVLQQELKKIIEQPIEAFKMNGIKYAHCCFCGQELVTTESVTAGYGPICASKYGLPWGEVPKEEMKLEDL